jgi:hypothetical protein
MAEEIELSNLSKEETENINKEITEVNNYAKEIENAAKSKEKTTEELDQMKKQLENLQKKCLENTAKALGVDPSFLNGFDFTKKEGGLTNPTEKKNAESFFNKLINGIKSVFKKLSPDFQNSIKEITESKTKTTEEKNSELKEAVDKEGEKQKKDTKWKDRLWELAKLLAIFGGIAGLFYGIYSGLCQAGHAKSGCYWYDSNGTPSQVQLSGAPDSCGLDKCCGKCPNSTDDPDLSCISGGSVQTCCNNSIDSQGSKHKNGSYSYKCVSAMQTLVDLVDNIVNTLSPSNIFDTVWKYVKVVLLVVGCIMAIYILWIIIKFFYEWNKKDSHSASVESTHSS